MQLAHSEIEANARRFHSLFTSLRKPESTKLYPDYETFRESLVEALKPAVVDDNFRDQAGVVLRHSLFQYTAASHLTTPEQIVKENFGVSPDEGEFGIFGPVTAPKAVESFRSKHELLLKQFGLL